MKLHRHARAGCAALTVVGALALTAAPGAAATEPPAPSAPSAAETLGADRPAPALLRAMERDLGITQAQAEKRLANEAEAGAVAGRLQNALGRDFAGAWVKGALSATVTVATTDPADVRVIEAAGAEAEVVRYGLTELESAKSSLDRAAVRSRSLDAPVWYVDVRTNTVTLQAAKRSAAEAFITATGVDRGLVRVRTSTERPRPLYDIRGGDAFYIGTGRCSVGFAVTTGTQQGFVTAGHCGTAGTATSGFNRIAQGTFQASTFPGSDHSWVATNTDWTATPYVNGQNGQNLQVTGSTEALVGASICRSGSTTGWHCGTIEQHNTSVSYLEGTVNGLTRTTVCAEPGDSGGPYVAGSQAQGVTSGGSGDCTSGGTTFHQPVNPVLEEYGLTLKTTTTDPGEADDAGATWTLGKVYRVGDQVGYDGSTYRCLQPHQAQQGWQPPNVPALWQRI
ncbi:carbohydrate-binding protein [Streptomyces sp. SP18CS02]|uniref:carbohydrate-binding protein n=1 Tax=Streptomyces sp. SP18CS02 TaxID=3002531 RepID=UPI002E789FFE|nr:carbohydrate-binding protein [Streptomyces sp. SP18CS02]MEE1751053.1 alpha-lytic protease prodomain-containing protein [Streptomyces sp. SP18CS02]